MTNSERDMIRPLDDSANEPDKTSATTHIERFTSLQPTYEDSVAPVPEEDWFEED